MMEQPTPYELRQEIRRIAHQDHKIFFHNDNVLENRLIQLERMVTDHLTDHKAHKRGE